MALCLWSDYQRTAGLFLETKTPVTVTMAHTYRHRGRNKNNIPFCGIQSSGGGSSGGGFFLACEDLGPSFDESFRTCAFIYYYHYSYFSVDQLAHTTWPFARTDSSTHFDKRSTQLPVSSNWRFNLPILKAVCRCFGKQHGHVLCSHFVYCLRRRVCMRSLIG